MASTREFKQKELPYLKNLKVPAGMIRKQYTPIEFLREYFDRGRIATYTKNGQLQCKKGRYRSFTDLHYILRSKFPTINIKESAFLYMNMYVNGWNERIGRYSRDNDRIYRDYLGISFCGTVMKIVTHISSFGIEYRSENRLISIENGLFSRNSLNKNIDAYELLFKRKGIDGFSLEFIMELANKWVKLNNMELKYE
jgi:hypothetical protein